MITNVQSFKSKVKNLAKAAGLSHTQIIQNFMFEKFLDRLSISAYKENFIIKGGCLLSSIMGLQLRTTMDIDANITGIAFTLDKITDIITEIISINIEDKILFKILKIEEIKEEQEYDGYRFTLNSKFENISVNFHLDISTGDIITPRAIEYSYKKILEDETISLLTYNKEKIIAEKLQSILDKKIGNSRMKDFYDLYHFVNFRWSEINLSHLTAAVLTTFAHRNTLDDLHNAKNIIHSLENDVSLNKLWNNYQIHFHYASDVSFSDCISAIIKIEESIK